MREYRLVTGLNHGAGMWYVLQWRDPEVEPDGDWHSIPTVNYADLSAEEKRRMEIELHT